MILMMLGAQGTGKGTVAGILSKRTGWPQISTGDIFRKNIAEEAELGIEANKYIAWIHSMPRILPDCRLDDNNFVNDCSEFVCVSEAVKNNLNKIEVIDSENVFIQNIKEILK